MSNNIVQQIDGELLVSSEVVAERTEKDHASILRTLDEHTDSFTEFGQVRFEIRPGYNNAPVRFALLNEHQATLLVTFMRNIGPVKEFKVELVKQFYAMRQALVKPVALPSTRELAQMVIEAEDARQVAEQRALEMEPKAAYVDRFVGQRSDLIKVDVFASQYGSTGPKVRALLIEKKLAVRTYVGERWSDSKQCMEEVYEWRQRQGVPTSHWFDVLPQHNVRRLHNGQVRQTMYVRQFHAHDLAQKLGLVEAVA